MLINVSIQGMMMYFMKKKLHLSHKGLIVFICFNCFYPLWPLHLDTI